MGNNFTEKCYEIRQFSKGLANPLIKNFTLKDLKFIKKENLKNVSSF